MPTEAAGQAGRQSLFLTLEALSGAPAVLLDARGHVEHANQRACALFESDDTAALQARWAELLPQIALPQDSAAGAARVSTLSLRTGVGTRRLVAQLHALNGPGGGYFAVLKDPLALDRFDRELILAAERRGWTHQREALMHDLKGILNAMQISLELLSEPQREPAAAAADAGHRDRRLAAVKDDLLRLDRALRALPGAEGHAEPPIAPFDVRELISEIFASLRQMLRRHRVELELHLPETPLALSGRRAWVRLALFNIALHRLGAMRAGGRLAVAARAAPQAIEVTFDSDVADVSAGMVDPAVRVPLAGRLGAQSSDALMDLQVARLILEAHGGELQLAARDAAGSRFTARLPHAAASPFAAAEKFSAGRALPR